MKLVMTLFVRNEEDILETNLRYHLERGVDLVIATDNLSEDGTPEILAEHARAGHLHLLRHTEDDYAQPEAMTRMARTAAEELGADWVIHNDADEFWWPHEGGLKEAFSAVPTRYGAVAAYRTNFVPRPEDGRTFPDRLDVVELPDIERLRDRDARREYGMRHFLVPKLAHRAVPEVEVLDASHGVAGPGLETAPGYRLYHEGGLADHYAAQVRDDRAVESGIAGGRLLRDRRLAAYLAGEDPRSVPGADLPSRAARETAIAEYEHWVVEKRLDGLTRRLEKRERRLEKLEGGR